jgi:hypothetical protein
MTHNKNRYKKKFRTGCSILRLKSSPVAWTDVLHGAYLGVKKLQFLILKKEFFQLYDFI